MFSFIIKGIIYKLNFEAFKKLMLAQLILINNNTQANDCKLRRNIPNKRARSWGSILIKYLRFLAFFFYNIVRTRWSCISFSLLYLFKNWIKNE